MTAIQKNIHHIDSIFHMLIQGVYVHVCARYEVSMIKPEAIIPDNNDT